MKKTNSLLNLGDVVRVNLPEKSMEGDYVVALIFESKEYNLFPVNTRQYNFQKIGSPYKDDELEEYEVFASLDNGSIEILDSNDFDRYHVLYHYEKTPSEHHSTIIVLPKEESKKMSDADLKKYFVNTAGDELDSTLDPEDGHLTINRVEPVIISWKKL